LARILSLCHNIQSISINYWGNRHGAPPYTPASLTATILSSIQNGNLRSIGFYCYTTNWIGGRTSPGNTDYNLLYEIVTSERAQFIKHLDLFTSIEKAETFELIRTRLTGLETLTMRDTLGEPIWVTDSTIEKPYWALYSNLRSLKLIGCYNVNPFHIPELFRHFRSLEHLLIAQSRGRNGPVVHNRQRGWSSVPEGWWNQRTPLKSLHIEHVYDWEVLAMGTIPTTELTAVRLCYTNASIVFKHDEELFPHLKTLCLEPFSEDRIRKGLAPAEDESVSSIWETRGIDIRRDGVPFLRYESTFMRVR
jgi:hypothetical protein